MNSASSRGSEARQRTVSPRRTLRTQRTAEDWGTASGLLRRAIASNLPPRHGSRLRRVVEVRLAASRGRGEPRGPCGWSRRPEGANGGTRPEASHDRGVVRAAGAPFFGTFFGGQRKYEVSSREGSPFRTVQRVPGPMSLYDNALSYQAIVRATGGSIVQMASIRRRRAGAGGGPDVERSSPQAGAS